MPEPNFNNLLFTWLLLALPVIYSFHHREWSHRWAIWAGLHWQAFSPSSHFVTLGLALVPIFGQNELAE